MPHYRSTSCSSQGHHQGHGQATASFWLRQIWKVSVKFHSTRCDGCCLPRLRVDISCVKLFHDIIQHWEMYGSVCDERLFKKLQLGSKGLDVGIKLLHNCIFYQRSAHFHTLFWVLYLVSSFLYCFHLLCPSCFHLFPLFFSSFTDCLLHPDSLHLCLDLF